MRTILVPLDGSPFAESALPVALGLARLAGARMRLARVHTYVPPAAAEGAFAFDQTADNLLRCSAREYLQQLADRLRPTVGVELDPRLLEGAAAAEALERAAADADLVVMTTHGRGPFARAWLGSVADQLVRRTRIPLLLLRSAGEREPAKAGAYRRLLVALDGSPLAEQALEKAVELGRLGGAAYLLLRVVEPPIRGGLDPSAFAGTGGQALLDQLQAMHERERKEAERYLDFIVNRLRASGLQAEAQVVVSESPAECILDHAKKANADIIALATHGRGGLPRLFLGSVADKVIRGAAVPVLVLRPV